MRSWGRGHRPKKHLVCGVALLFSLSACFRPAPPVEEGDGLDPAFSTEQLSDGTVVVSSGHPVLRKRIERSSVIMTTSNTPKSDTPTVTSTEPAGAETPENTSATQEKYWHHEAYIKAANANSHDYFGSSVSLSGDTLAVGAQYERSNQTTITNGTGASSDNSLYWSGAVYMYRRSGVNWAQEAYIKAANANSHDYFGSSVSLSGDTVAVGAQYEDSNQTTITNGTGASGDNSLSDSGAVYIYRRSGVNWAQEAYIKAANANSSDVFGSSVSLSGDTLAVGAPYEDSNQRTITNGPSASGINLSSSSSSGAAYVYRRSGVNWAQEAYIKAANADGGDLFGNSVSLSGDTLAVGAQYEDSNQRTITNGPSASGINLSSYSSSGAVYVYRRSGVNWAQEAYIKAANAGQSDHFGGSVSLSGDTLAVGARYEDSNQTTITNGTGASSYNLLYDSGAVYMYRRSGVNWAQEAYIKAANANSSDYFGGSVSLSGDTLAVGAPYEDSNQTTITNGATSSDNNKQPQSGAVYVYRRSGVNWEQEAYVKAPNAYFERSFGRVSVSGDTLAVGDPVERSLSTQIIHGSSVPIDNSSYSAGAVYVFRNVSRQFEPDVRVSAVTATAVTLSWHANLGNAEQLIVAQAALGTSAPLAGCSGGLMLAKGTTSYTYSGLTTGTRYGFRLCATNGDATSDGVPIWATTQ